MTLGSTQPLTEMSTRSIPCGQRRSVRKLEGRGFDSWWCHWNFTFT